MYARFSLILLATTAALHGADFIRQIQTIAGASVIYDMPLGSDQGQVTSKPLTTDSAIFQLYATTTTTSGTSTVVKLDEKTVGTFLPQVTVQALSEDPYFPARTRADKPYGMRIVVAGMQSASAVAPDYAKKVQVARSYKLYDSTTYLPNGSTGTYADSFVFQTNGTFTDNAILQRLPVTSPTKAVGEESFTVFLHPDAASPQSELAKATVKIWPVADGKIEKLEEGKTYRAAPLDGSVILHDLYPKSVTYAQIYSGKQVTGTKGTPLPSTVVSYDTYSPQNAQLALADIGQFLKVDGDYTVEVLTITPFNGGAPELLASVTFKLKRSLEVNGSVTSMEQ